VAVVGNPNAGKTTLFNALTGLRQKVANYPGVTVEQKTGSLQGASSPIELIDLPGTYSLAAHSPDEMVVVDVLLGNATPLPRPDLVLAVLDASNLERNLYLVSQLLELDLPVVVALNMNDVAERRGMRVDAQQLRTLLGAEVVPVQAKSGRGIQELKETLDRALLEKSLPKPQQAFCLPDEIIEACSHLEKTLGTLTQQKMSRPLHRSEWVRTLIDEGGYAEERLLGALGDQAATPLQETRRSLQCADVPLSAREATSRYRWIRQLVGHCLQRDPEGDDHRTERIDAVVTHKVFGLLLFALTMLLLFQSIFTWAGPLMDAINAGFGWLGKSAGSLLPEGALQSLLVDGVIAGVGAVVIFLPQILLLFLFLAILEDCGYMARAAFLMDRLMSRCGLSGKSFIPMLSGYACAVPAIMAARVIENRRDRLATVLVTPLMTCSARLPVYAVLIGAFVPAHSYLGGWLGLQALTMFGLYLLGVVTAVAMAWLFKKTLLAGPTPPFVLELPSYKWPAARSVLLRLYEAARAFLVRAGTVILAVTIVIWALAYFPHPAEIAQDYEAQRASLQANTPEELEEKRTSLHHAESAAYLEQSLFGRAGHAVEPVFRPLGWDWRLSMATLASFPAREVILATLGTIFSLGADVDEESEDLSSSLQAATWPDGRPLFALPTALSVLVFFALCCQCGATVATIRREANSWGWAIFTFVYMTALAYGAALFTYQVGSALA
jgi:ferrous iron transport protein B